MAYASSRHAVRRLAAEAARGARARAAVFEFTTSYMYPASGLVYVGLT